MSNPFNLHDENSYFGKYIAMFLVMCFACCGWVCQKWEDSRRLTARKEFEKGDFQILFVLEQDPKATESLLAAADGRYDEKRPTTTLTSDLGIVELFAVEGIKVSGLPTPRFIQKFTFPDVNRMMPSYSVIYEVYKAPN